MVAKASTVVILSVLLRSASRKRTGGIRGRLVVCWWMGLL